jgi:hypothetical protein
VRLRDKLTQAERTIGRGLDVLPALSADAINATDVALRGRQAESFLAVAELRGEVHRILDRWRQESRSRAPRERSECSVIPSERLIPSERSESRDLQTASRDLHLAEPIIAATQSSAHGWIAVLDDGRLIASHTENHRIMEHDAAATEDADAVVHALRHADGAARQANDLASITARRSIEQWIAHDSARRACAITPHQSPLRRRMLRRIESALSSVPRHRRHPALSLASTLRSALEGRLTLGVERALDALPDDQDGSRWLACAVAVLSAPGSPGSPTEHSASATRVRAIILFRPD